MNSKRERQAKRWQEGPFHLLPIYKFGLGEIITKHKHLPPKVKNAARAIVAEFRDKPYIDRNLRRLARDKCGISDNTLRKYRVILEEKGILRFETPPYWKRNQTQFEVATRIWFPTKRVEKWLRDKGFLEANRKSEAWISSYPTASKVSPNPTSNETQLYQEAVHGAPAAPLPPTAPPASLTLAGVSKGAAATPHPARKQEREDPEGRPAYGAESANELANGAMVARWYPGRDSQLGEQDIEGTLERPYDLPAYIQVGVRFKDPGANRYVVVGYSQEELPSEDSILARDEETGELYWIETELVEPINRFAIGDAVHFADLGKGTVMAVDGANVSVNFADGIIRSVPASQLDAA